jgi:DNA-damage-inducible protein D
MELGDENFAVALFKDFPIRRKFYDGRWFYSIVDIIAAITQSKHPTRYWTDVKSRLSQEASEVYANCVKLPFPAANSKIYKTECADRETILRIVQTIPHPNAEPFKLWLAQVGNEALEPESADEHARRLAYRRMLYRIRTGLHEDIHQRGIVTGKQEQEFDDAGYQGLYENMTKADLLFRFGLMPNDEPEDKMCSEELADNVFMDAQTRSLIQRRNITGAQNLNTAHYDVGLETRLTIERLGGTMPEHLPSAKRLTHGQYLPQFAHEWEALPNAPSSASTDADITTDEAGVPPDE